MTVELLIMTVASFGMLLTSIFCYTLAEKLQKQRQIIESLRSERSESFMGGSL
jgi:hypothetical protein